MSAEAVPFLETLRGGAAVASAAGVVILAVLLLALVAKVLLQGAGRSARRSAPRWLDVVTVPLLLAFVIIVLERFRDLS